MLEELQCDGSLGREERQKYDNFRAFFHLSSDFMWVLDNQGAIVAINQTVTKRLGYAIDELRGKSVLSVHPAAVRDQVLQVVAEMLAGERDVCPHPLEARDGTWIPVETRIVPNVTWDGQPAIFGMSRDTSELSRSEDKLAQIFRYSQSLVSVWEEETGKLIDLNRRFTEVSGYTFGDLEGFTYQDIGRIADFGDTEPLAEAAAAGEIPVVETALTIKDGSKIYGNLAVFRVEVQGEGFLVADFQDLTPLWRAEQALRQSEERLERVLAGADLGSWDWNLQTDEVTRDARWFRMLGYESCDVPPVIGEWRDRIHPDDVPGVLEVLDKHFRGELSEYEALYRLEAKSGRWRWMLDRGSVTQRDADGTPLLMSGTQMDVTEKQEAQREVERRDLLLSGLAQAMSHLLSDSAGLSDTAIQAALEELGHAAGVDRVYIFEHRDGGPGERGFCSQRFEWSRDSVTPQIDNPELQDIPWDMMASRWYDTFIEGGYIAGDVKDFPQDERDGLEPQDIISLLALPIMNNGHLWGFIGFDECQAPRHWGDSEVALLEAAGSAFGAAIERKRLAAQLMETAEQNRQLAERTVFESRERLEKMVTDVAEAMGRVVEVRDPYTRGHQQRTEMIAAMIAREMGLDEYTVEAVQMAAFVHDVGKLAVPVEILTKTGELSEVEFALIREHPRAGYEILKDIDFPWPIADIVLQHHERYDGSGYPCALAGEQILLPARIIAVADLIEAISSARPYRPKKGIEQAISALRDSGGLFDSQVTAAALRLYERGVLCEELMA